MSTTQLFDCWIHQLGELETSQVFNQDQYKKLADDVSSRIRPAFFDVLNKNILLYLRDYNGKTKKVEYDIGICISKRSELFSSVLFSLITYLLEFPEVSGDCLDRLEKIISDHNKREHKAYSIPHACVTLVNFLYSNDKNLGAVIGLVDRMTQLPARYRYWTIALGISFHAMHIRSEQLGDESRFDFLMYLKAAEYLTQAVENGKYEGFITEADREHVSLTCLISLARLVAATIPSFYTGKEFPTRLRLCLPQSTDRSLILPFGSFLTEHTESLSQALLVLNHLSQHYGLYIDRLNLRWMRDLYFESTLNAYSGEVLAEHALTFPFYEKYRRHFIEYFLSGIYDLDIYKNNFNEHALTDRMGSGVFIVRVHDMLKALAIESQTNSFTFPMIS